MEIRRQQRHSRILAQPNPPDIPQVPLSTQSTVAPSFLTGPAHKLRPFPNKFREVIERVKLISQCECATKCPFPDRATFLNIMSVECFSEALLECEGVPPSELKSY